MTDYAYKTANALIGKKIRALEIDGFRIWLTCDDGTRLEYMASDGGYSCWTATLPDGRVVG